MGDLNEIYSEITLHSAAGISLAKREMPVDASHLHLFKAQPDNSRVLKEKLEKTGFKVIASSPFGLSILGPKKLYKDFFKTSILERQVSTFYGTKAGAPTTSYFMEVVPPMPKEVQGLANSIYIPKMGYFLAGEGPMPNPDYYSLKPPGDITRLLGADYAHTKGIRGSGIKTAVLDSGFIEDHVYYASKNYNITVKAALGSVELDEVGHGTGISANLLAVAPGCDFHFYKTTDGSQWATLAAFRMAVEDGVKVISCSWGQINDPVLEAEIVSAVQSGITVVFSAGNNGPIGWPGCHPDVISVGGVFPRQDGTWAASNYASSGVHFSYPERRCPDVCAICGEMPLGIFIVMPTMKNSKFDRFFAGENYPGNDQTSMEDGWLVASGTSASAPMVAGAAALLLEIKPDLSPADIKSILKETSFDIFEGESASGDIAGIGPDSATGAGMINLADAVEKAKTIKSCPVAPVEVCTRAPIVQICTAGPSLCERAPVVQCTRAPITQSCHPGPAICKRAPKPICFRGPNRQILEANPANDSEKVPVTVWVNKNELQKWTDMEGTEIGLDNEYENFPPVKGCNRGPFDPKILNK